MAQAVKARRLLAGLPPLGNALAQGLQLVAAKKRGRISHELLTYHLSKAKRETLWLKR
ncbi:MAG: hypothetical protein RR473_12440 [Comamonas sp.]